ncbi:putative carboxylesterase 7 [Panicum miliaceum]|uniref:Carboxylesterase 7 n=1 Tax=Panicum miliaceum TaxID=4540 RepID=A0A3L6S054_PANMI|nr:putative carboxylesterase 7 [Panicum miliaceum]
MASRTRFCSRCLASLALPFLFFTSLLYLPTRQPVLDIAVREEAAAGRLRLIVDRAAAAVEANATVTTDAVVKKSNTAAVATEDGDGDVMTDAPPASGDANVTTYDVQAYDIAAAGAVAVSVNYRLAPEHPLPAAYDDAWAALQWTVSSCLSGPEPWLADHGDAKRIFLAGDSAGGNIAHN